MINILKNNFQIDTPDAIIVVNKNRKIIAFNDDAERMTGYNSKKIINKDIQILFKTSKDDIEYISSAIKDNDSYINVTLNITAADASTVSVLASLTPVYQPKIGQLGVIIVLRNMQEMKLLQDNLKNINYKLLMEHNLLDSVFNNINEGIFTIDRDKVITSFNRAAAEITGYSIEKAIGKKYRSILRYSKEELIDYCESI